MPRLLLASLILAAAAFAQPQLEITRATYGAGTVQADVTDRVRSLVANGGLNIEVNGSTLGMDPVPNTKKTLRVEYTLGGVRRIADARDFETLRIGNVPPESLRILKATVSTDVTSELSARVANNRLNLPMNSPILRGGRERTLTVEYELNGVRKTQTLKEGEALQLNAAAPASAPASAPRAAALTILRATYGAGRRSTNDVTRAVSEKVVDNQLQLAVNGDSLGGDPAPGSVKTLVIQYEFDGRRQTVTARDGETVFIPEVAALNILSAAYGVPGRSVDVTRSLASRVSNLRLELPVNASTMGSDPAPGMVKTLSVEYEVNGRRASASARDGETLTLPAAPQPSFAIPASGAGNVCLYREPDYRGESVCIALGGQLSSIAGWQQGFRSIRLNGARSVEVFNEPGFRGRGETISADTADLQSLPNSWWRYDSAARVQSIRAR